MKSFKDETGRGWDVVVNIGAIKDVRDLLQVDLCKFFDTEGQRVLGDQPLMVDVLFVLCKKQCEERKMTDRDFGALFASDVLEEASNALVGAVVDFFPKSRQPTLNSWVTKAKALGTEANSRAMQAIESLTLDQLIASRPAIKSQG